MMEWNEVNWSSILFVGFVIIALLVPVLSTCDVNNYCILNEAENITIRFTNNSLPYTGGTISISIYKGIDKIISDDNMTELDDGRYYYEMTNYGINETGNYVYYANTSDGSYYATVSDIWEIVEEFPSTQINETNYYIEDSDSVLYNNTWSYTTRTLTSIGSNILQEIAAYVWSYTYKAIDSVPIIQEYIDRYGTTRTRVVQSSERDEYIDDPRYGGTTRYGEGER